MRKKCIDIYFCFTCKTQLEHTWENKGQKARKLWYCPEQWRDVQWWNVRRYLFYWHPCKDDGVTNHQMRWKLSGQKFSAKAVTDLVVI